MNAPFAAFFKFEMLDRIRDVSLCPVHACLFEGAVQELSRRAYKRAPLQVFLISRLFPDHQYSRLAVPFPGNGLGGMQIEIAALTVLHGRPENGQRRMVRDDRHMNHGRLNQFSNFRTEDVLYDFASILCPSGQRFREM